MGSTQRPVRIANCSGAVPDPGIHMYNQAYYGEVDVITGDYLAEVNLANDAEAFVKGEHPGWCQTAWDGIELSAEIVAKKRIKVVINGGSLNPKGMAIKVHEFVKSKNLDLKVAFVEGDNLMHKVDGILNEALSHLDHENSNVQLAKDTQRFLQDRERMPVISANAYLGGRAIRRALEEGADIVICGRVADASPVIGAAAWWHQWAPDNFDALAGALVAGHLIECSTYITGANFAGFDRYPMNELLNLGLGIVEVDANGDSVVTKHEALNGFVTEDTVKCQFLYELQGNIYLNSDVKADVGQITVQQVGKNRVKVSGIKGYPPPSTTKLAIFYRGGYQAELLVNATGYATAKKYELHEAQLKNRLKEWNMLDKFDVLDFQWVGRPQPNPTCQLASTTYLRIFAQAVEKDVIGKMMAAWATNVMQHFSGMHSSLDMRTAAPKPFIAFYPGIVEQKDLDESFSVIGSDGSDLRTTKIGPPEKTEKLQPREDYDTESPVDIASFGETVMAPLGDVALARSGDKGANINFGAFVHTQEEWDWLRTLLTKAKMRELMGTDWQDWYHLERVEMPNIKAVHFVIYGPLGRGVTSSKLLDGLGKGFADFIRDVHVPIPKKFLQGKL
ncbi:unnamed protein product [Zymoseptoria tritici ST99CH_3D1]|nr:unnamed protein product [Zymoseptoria tritici ST99CH_3D1]